MFPFMTTQNLPWTDDYSTLASFLLNDRKTESLPKDVYVEGDDTVIEIDVPGANDKNLEVTVKDRILSVTWTRKRRSGEERGSRFFSLDKDADEASIKATVIDGVLTVRISKKPQAEGRKIPVLAK